MFVFALGGRVLAQMETATLSGTVTDPTGAVVSGAEVRAIRIDTGTNYVSTTNTSGLYLIVGLQPGRFRIFATKQGFKQIELTDITLNVQDTVSRNFSLEIGAASETVTVRADDLHINVTDATVSTVVDRQFAENLPLNGRSFQTLIQLTPGVVLTSSNFGDAGQFSVNGQRAASNYWTVDGVSANIGSGVTILGTSGNGLGGSLGSFSVFGGTNSLVSVDALQEFRIQTSTYAPEFGRTPGGQISIVTRSGTNQFHGTAFDYLRNDLFDANSWFNTFAIPTLPKARERQNDFGGTFAGPILKDRTFFFFSYEGLRLRLPQTTLTTVPDPNARQSAAPAMQPFLNAYPLPNGADNAATGIAQFNASYSNPASLDAYSLRIDHKLSHNWTLFGRYNYSPSEIAQRGFGGPLSDISSFRITTQTGTVAVTWAISPTVANDLRFNYSRTDASNSFSLDNFGGAVPLTSLPFPGQFTSENGQLSFNIASLQQGQFFVGQNGRNLQRQINIVDSVSIQKGSHSLKFGVDFRRLSPLVQLNGYGQTAFFLNVPSAESGNLLFSVVTANRSATFLFRNQGIYVQDTWRVTPRFTLTYGLRWDIDFVPESLSGPNFPAVTGFNLNDLSKLALAPNGTSPYATTYDNFAPRVGGAYQISQSQNWKTVFRGGFGVFYDLASSEAGNLFFNSNYPFGASVFCLSFIQFPGCPSSLTFPLDPATAAPPPITPAGLKNPTSGSINAFDPNLKLPYTLEWNVAIEQALGTQQMISASYVGAAGHRLIQTARIFFPTPVCCAGALLVTNAGTSNYNALQLQFQRRLSHGLQVLGSYVWSHSIDDGSAGSIGVASNQLGPSGVVGSNRGSSDFDIRNAFSAGVTYDVPAPKLNPFTNAVLRGWSLQNVIQVRSAPPVTVFDALFFRGISGFQTSVRPDLVAGQGLYVFGANCAQVFQTLKELLPGQGCPGGKGFNPSAFAPPPTDANGNPLRQGTLGRNALRGFGAAQWDFAVHRDFPIHESVKLQFRAEMFNVLNHPNFGQPNGQFGLGGFGLTNQTLGQSLNSSNLGGGGFSPLYQIGGPRSMQFALKLFF
jgi:hypothetical protein